MQSGSEWGQTGIRKKATEKSGQRRWPLYTQHPSQGSVNPRRPFCANSCLERNPDLGRWDDNKATRVKEAADIMGRYE